MSADVYIIIDKEGSILFSTIPIIISGPKNVRSSTHLLKMRLALEVSDCIGYFVIPENMMGNFIQYYSLSFRY